MTWTIMCGTSIMLILWFLFPVYQNFILCSLGIFRILSLKICEVGLIYTWISRNLNQRRLLEDIYSLQIQEDLNRFFSSNMAGNWEEWSHQFPLFLKNVWLQFNNILPQKVMPEVWTLIYLVQQNLLVPRVRVQESYL